MKQKDEKKDAKVLSQEELENIVGSPSAATPTSTSTMVPMRRDSTRTLSSIMVATACSWVTSTSPSSATCT